LGDILGKKVGIFEEHSRHSWILQFMVLGRCHHGVLKLHLTLWSKMDVP
jgi:hypothetical protein